MRHRPPLAVVPVFARCRWCAGVFRTCVAWIDDPGTSYRRCRWCARLTKLPDDDPAQLVPVAAEASGTRQTRRRGHDV